MHDKGLFTKPEQQAEQQYPDHSRLFAGDFAAPFVKTSVAVKFPHQQQKQRKKPQVLDEPERPRAADRPHEILGHARHAVESSGLSRHKRIEIADHPLENKQADGGRNKQFPRAAPEPLSCRMTLQGIPRTHARKQKKQRHEPRVKDIHDHILILRPIPETADTTEDTLVVKEVNHMVEQH